MVKNQKKEEHDHPERRLSSLTVNDKKEKKRP